MANFIGQSIRYYQFLKQYCEGGMTVINKAFEPRLEWDEAIKVFSTTKFLRKAGSENASPARQSSEQPAAPSKIQNKQSKPGSAGRTGNPPLHMVQI